jgi:hypothetical protein
MGRGFFMELESYSDFLAERWDASNMIGTSVMYDATMKKK